MSRMQRVVVIIASISYCPVYFRRTAAEIAYYTDEWSNGFSIYVQKHFEWIYFLS